MAYEYLFPFQENFGKHGVAALNLTMDYDENEIITNNLKYLTNTLEVYADPVVPLKEKTLQFGPGMTQTGLYSQI